MFRDAAPDGSPNTGYLLFEDNNHQRALVSAGQLGANLHRRKVALVILSACQSAAQGDADAEPLGSVAARLTATGIPAVLAMTHSVLVATTRVLFGEFYKHLAKGRSLGLALDSARIYLKNRPEKFEVQRGPERVPLRLHDWFIPALYQSGTDKPLLADATQADGSVSKPGRVFRPGPKRVSLAVAVRCGRSSVVSRERRRAASPSPASAARAKPRWLWKPGAGWCAPVCFAPPRS
ncbi:MAG: CHAT domain-containing protein [Synechococcaceae cyanobacterium SM1_2_3]|nr:CHAT domain-containing protein [Synechococcaceae cyanobacterium SM1_2_3]